MASYLASASTCLQFANELTAEYDSNSTFLVRPLLPIYRRFVDSELQKQTKQRIAPAN